jgi:hypothetical protein
MRQKAPKAAAYTTDSESSFMASRTLTTKQIEQQLREKGELLARFSYKSFALLEYSTHGTLVFARYLTCNGRTDGRDARDMSTVKSSGAAPL